MKIVVIYFFNLYLYIFVRRTGGLGGKLWNLILKLVLSLVVT